MITKKRHILSAFVVVAAMVAAMAPSATAMAPTKRVVDDPVNPNSAYDIVQVVLRSAPEAGKPAVVVVKHGRNETVGDSVDMWFNLDDDRQPDVHIVGDAGSEYRVFKTDSFIEDGKEISNRGCYSMSIRLNKTKVKFYPDCMG